MQIKLFDQPHLSEIGQLVPIRFAFAKVEGDTATALMPLVKCRDFLLDVVYSNAHPTELSAYSVYGMSYDVTKNPLDKSKTCFIVEFQNEAQKKNFVKHLPMLHKIEEHNGFQKTTVHDADGIFLVTEGDPQWQSICIATNIYTMIMKFLAYDIDYSKKIYDYLKEETWVTPTQFAVPAEVSYLVQVTPQFFEFLCQNLRSVISQAQQGYAHGKDTQDKDVSNIHNYSGICSVHRNVVFREDVSTFYTKLRDMWQNWKHEFDLFSLESLK